MGPVRAATLDDGLRARAFWWPPLRLVRLRLERECVRSWRRCEPGDAGLRDGVDARERPGGPERAVGAEVQGLGEAPPIREGTVGARVPAGGVAGGGVERGEVLAGLAADRVELAARVDDPPVEHYGEDLGSSDATAGSRIPARRRPGRGVERGDGVPRLAPDRAEIAARVDGRPGDHDCVDEA